MTFHPDKCSVLTITNKNNPPEVTGAISDDSASRTTVCVRFDKKVEIQFNV
jgi:hypothetical protein